jgi:hypothetical protein
LLLPGLLSAIAITISIKDPGGAAVPGAEVVIAGRTLTSDAAAGAVVLSDLPDGSYTLTIRKAGFEPAEQRIEVKTGGATSFTLSLKLAAQQTTLEVDSKRSSLTRTRLIGPYAAHPSSAITAFRTWKFSAIWERSPSTPASSAFWRRFSEKP